MALSNYSDLLASITSWMARVDLSGSAADFVTLAEARLNRELNPVETDATLTGTVGSRAIDITTQKCVEPIALFLAKSGEDERELVKKTDGTFPYLTESGEPAIWAIDGDEINFDRTLDQAYPFRFRFRQRFALSDTQPTNWLLTNHPDVYLASCLIWGGLFTKNTGYASPFFTALEVGIPEVRNIIAQKKRAVATVDPGLAYRAGYFYNGYNE